MGGRAGGGASGGMGSRSRAGAAKAAASGSSNGVTNLFKGGWNENSGETSEIQIHGINKQTEKALNVKTIVSWGNGSGKEKDLWVPKSTIGHIDKDSSGRIIMTMKKSMAQSISQQNAYKGYQMQFDWSYNT